jgi:hypothetical protein
VSQHAGSVGCKNNVDPNQRFSFMAVRCFLYSVGDIFRRCDNCCSLADCLAHVRNMSPIILP